MSASLNERERLVLRLRQEGYTLKEIGEKIPRRDGRQGPIGREAIRQIESKALRKITYAMEREDSRVFIATIAKRTDDLPK
jgi:DNA-directed RNA polymerase sigma subunit (sigma70/sigma32)